MKTRDKILFTALKLFNAWGSPNITLRRIASEMFISQGNLNYHFNLREDIHVALFEQFATELDAINLTFDEKDFNIFNTISSMKPRMEVYYKYRYISSDFNQIMRENPTLLHQYKQIENKHFLELQHFFQLAVQEGALRAPAFEGEYKEFAERIRIFQLFWPASVTLTEVEESKIVDAYHALFIEMLFPYFSRETQREYLIKKM
ncbi:MAG TPA: TetR/AcrR family transcriptional regulator [Fluviicola sp.]|nr:TetR/AcrR family transcriptional regulator [Fluviicola sp.]